MIDNYAPFRMIEQNINEAARRMAVSGIENGHIYILGVMTLVVIYMGLTVASGGMSLDRLKMFCMKIAAVIALLSMNWWMGMIAPAIVNDMPSIITAGAQGVGGGDLFQQAAAMERQIQAITAKLEVSAGPLWLPIYGTPIYIADLTARALAGVIFLIMFFFRLCLHVVVTYLAWMLLLLVFDSMRGYFMAGIGIIVSIFCAMIGCMIVYTAVMIGLDVMAIELIAAIDGAGISKGISAFGSFIGKMLACVFLLLLTAWIAGRIGGGYVVMAAGAGVAALGATVMGAAKAGAVAVNEARASGGNGSNKSGSAPQGGGNSGNGGSPRGGRGGLPMI